ncbi:uncharacterized protein si:dkey-27h10.2 [Scophthalmus maximus]|uniref:uncharacterized protein si:dkey-27h10.2 n=1 Tax=Scophthalmus maximus TaxID=52904 RepID=UPI001FA912DA|nr:uncharacterized protein si:dkey-27h10.2 [Scophthalmus maximus]XP_035493477.2 uncharacterized protein si:dkey-27h10.2 [Scophthalmus maximus]
MELIDPSFFIMGLVLASAIGDETTTNSGSTVTWEFDDQLFDRNNYKSTTVPSTTSVSNITSNMNITDNINSTTMASTTNQKGGETTKGGKDLATRKPTGPFRTTSANDKEKDKTVTPRPRSAGNTTGIIILLVIIVALAFGVIYYIVRKRGRRYSVDFTSRQDEANIPLSIVDPQMPADTVSQNGLQTFGSAETATKEPQEPEATPAAQAEQTTEADGSVAEASAESAAAPAPSPDSTEDEPNEDVVEQSPPAPVQPSGEEKTDDEGADSNKTSVESLKETNENNSNNADFSQKRDLHSSNSFWDVPLNCPV